MFKKNCRIFNSQRPTSYEKLVYTKFIFRQRFVPGEWGGCYSSFQTPFVGWGDASSYDLHAETSPSSQRCPAHHTAATLVHAFVTSRMDYCNVLLAGALKAKTEKLQRPLNAAARLLSGTISLIVDCPRLCMSTFIGLMFLSE